MSYLACKICIMTKGLKGSEIGGLPKTPAELIEHVERDHNIPVRREGETEEQTMKRFYAQYPEAKNPETCKCPDCCERRERKPADTPAQEDKP